MTNWHDNCCANKLCIQCRALCIRAYLKLPLWLYEDCLLCSNQVKGFGKGTRAGGGGRRERVVAVGLELVLLKLYVKILMKPVLALDKKLSTKPN